MVLPRSLAVLLFAASGLVVPLSAWEAAPRTPFSWWRFGAAYEPVSQRVYFLGGRGAGDATDATVWSFDPLSEHFSATGVHLAVPVSNHQLAVLDDGSGPGIYIFGERDAAGEPVMEVQVYRPQSQSIEILSEDPFPGRVRFGELPLGKAVAVVDNRAYVIGGFSPLARDASTATWIFDPAAAPGARWSQGPPLSVARAYVVTAVLDGKLYALGGDRVDRELGILLPTAITERLDPLDLEAGWSDAAVADLPQGCDESVAFGFDSDSSSCGYAGQIVIAGCGRWHVEDRRVWVYERAADRWQENPLALEQPRRNHAGARLPQIAGAPLDTPALLVFGGRQDDDNHLLDLTERLPLGRCDAIGLALAANGASFAPEQRLTLRLQTEGPGDRRADVYAALLLPGGELYGFPPEGGLAAGLQPPLIADQAIGADELLVLDAVLPPGLPAGGYTAAAVAVEPGADPLDSTGWLHFATAEFEVTE